MQLLCFPCAGGNSATYRDWSKRFSAPICVRSIELPGRLSRFKERPCARLEDLLAIILPELEQYVTSPYALFGHSMGALIAFEVARALAQSRTKPSHLFVSGFPAPQLPSHTLPIYELGDAQFLACINHYAHIPTEALCSPALMELLLPILRADLELCTNYHYVKGPPVNCPINAYGGKYDPFVSEFALNEWRLQTVYEFRVRTFVGNHHYVANNLSELLDDIQRTLSPHMAQRIPLSLTKRNGSQTR